MNFKTTLFLAIMAIGVGAALYLTMQEDAATTDTDTDATTEARRLFSEDDLADVDRIELVRDTDTLIFARNEAGDGWDIVEPMQMPADQYKVETALFEMAKGMTYGRVYGVGGADRPTVEFAGLTDTPATARVRFLKGTDVKAELLVGKSLPIGSGTYVKVVGKDEIYESVDDLSDTFTQPLKGYRSNTILKFNIADVKKVTLSGALAYEMTRTDSGWLIENPTRSRADTYKVEAVVRAMAGLAVQKFRDDNPEDALLAIYGLDKPALSMTVDLVQKVKDPEDAAKTIDQAKQYTLMIGKPIDAEGSAYFAKLNISPWVFLISKFTFNSVSTSVADLRDKTLAMVNAPKVKAIEIKSGETIIDLDNKDGAWLFADETSADSASVADLIQAVNNLKATSFVEPGSMVEIDWLSPRSTVTLTEEGNPNPTTILVGPTSGPKGRMVYVRNAAEEAVALVMAEDVEPLLVTAVSFRDRKVMEFPRERLKKIEIAETGKADIVLERKGDTLEWQMTAPIKADADPDAVRNVEQSLASMTALKIVGSGDRAAYGLDQPELTVTASLLPLASETGAEVVGETKPAQDAAADSPEAKRVRQLEELLAFQLSLPLEADDSDQPIQNPKATKMLREQLAEAKAAVKGDEPSAVVVRRVLVSRKSERVYACLEDGDLVYEMDVTFYDDLKAEMHDTRITSFALDDVQALALGTGDDRVAFGKSSDGKWACRSEPGLPIDEEKIKEVLNDLRDLRTLRFAAYAAADLKPFGLDEAADVQVLEVTLSGKAPVVLRLSKVGPEDDPDGSRYAVLAGSSKVFLLAADQTTKLGRTLSDFEK